MAARCETICSLGWWLAHQTATRKPRGAPVPLGPSAPRHQRSYRQRVLQRAAASRRWWRRTYRRQGQASGRGRQRARCARLGRPRTSPPRPISSVMHAHPACTEPAGIRSRSSRYPSVCRRPRRSRTSPSRSAAVESRISPTWSTHRDAQHRWDRKRGMRKSALRRTSELLVPICRLALPSHTMRPSARRPAAAVLTGALCACVCLLSLH